MNESKKHISAYNHMLERVKAFMDEAESEFKPKFQYAIEAAKEKATELGELTQEEAEHIGDYLKRDLVEAAEHLAETEDEFKDWLRFDLELIEAQYGDLFSLVVDKTRLELDLLADYAQRVGVWHSGEITGIGTLQCENCCKILHFHDTGHVPPCPECHKTTFRRFFDSA